MKSSRREFLKYSLASTAFGVSVLNQRDIFSETKKGSGLLTDYEDCLRDRLWMWGHVDSDSFNKAWGIPLTKDSITLAGAIDYMGIPNVCAICTVGNKKFREQFQKVKRVTWTICPGSKQGYQAMRKPVFDLFDEMSNITGVHLDDFYLNGKPEKIQTERGEVEVAPSALSMRELSELHLELGRRKRPIELGLVFYTRQLHFGKSMLPSIDQTDFVSFWTWSGPDLWKMEDNFREYRRLVRTKRTMLGVYMWDFGNKKILPLDLMKHQLDLGLRLFERGEIEGMIFHCTPLCNKGLEAVEYSKKWIEEHANAVCKNKGRC